MSQPNFQTYFTKTIHKSSYPSISPSNPALSASGKTAFITAGASRIGFAIAEGYAAASTSNLILLSRREANLKEASEKLTSAYPNTKVHVYACSVADFTAITHVFSDIKSKIGNLNMFISSACNYQYQNTAFQISLSHTKETFDTVVLGGINVLNAFLTTFPPSKEKEKAFINLSSCSAHLVLPTAEAAFATILQHYHVEYAEKGLNVYSFHLGGVYTDAEKEFGVPREAIDWDEPSLPGGFALWLGSEQARLLWSAWDVEELLARMEQIEKDEELLKMGLIVGGHKVYGVDKIVVDRASDKATT